MTGREKRLGEDNSSLIHQVLGSLKKQPITPTTMAGEAGFIAGRSLGAGWWVVFSDVNAGVSASFFVEEGGDFKLSIIHDGTGANNGREASGKLYITYDVDGGTETWDISAANWDIPLSNAAILNIEEYGTQFTVADNSKVGVVWIKDDNAGGAGGNMWVYGFILKRQ